MRESRLVQGFMDFYQGWMRNESYTLSRNERFQNQFSRYQPRWQVSFLRVKLTLFVEKGNSGIYEVPMNNGGYFSKSRTHVGRLLVRQQHCAVQSQAHTKDRQRKKIDIFITNLIIKYYNQIIILSRLQRIRINPCINQKQPTNCVKSYNTDIIYLQSH